MPLTRPSPAEIWLARWRGVTPSSPIEIMKSLMIDAPAEVPPTTAPRSCARCRASPRGVPGSSCESRSWLPPLMNTPVAPSTRATRSGSCASARVAGFTTSTPGAPSRVKTSVYDATTSAWNDEAVGIRTSRDRRPPASLRNWRSSEALPTRSSAPPMTKSVGVVEG